MCGIFAWTGTGPPDPDLIEQAAKAAGRRGPHGHGWAAAGPAGFTVTRHPGQVNGSAAELRQLAARLIVGHARLATFGDWQDTSQIQPVIAGGHAIAHNGNIYNAADLGGPAPTDTIAFAAAYATARATMLPELALSSLVDAAAQTAWAIVIADADGQLYAHRRYHPLYQHPTATGVYLCSFPLDPGDRQLAQNQVTVITPGGRR